MNEVQKLIDAILNAPPGPGTQMGPSQTADGQKAATMRQQVTLQLTHHQNVTVRIEAAEMLGEYVSPQAESALLELSQDKDSSVRQQALQSLENFHNEAVTQAILEALKDSDYVVRATAAEILGNQGEAKAVEPLINSLKDSFYMVRATAAEALGKMEAFLAAPALRDLLLDSDQWVRYSAAESLSQIEPEEEIWQILMEANCTDPSARLEAVKDLQNLVDSRSIPTLVRLLKDEAEISSAALNTLESFHDPIVVPALVETALFTDQAHIREQALLQAQQISLDATISALSSWLDTEQAHFAQKAIEVLRQLPTLDTTPIFLDALEHNDLWVRTVSMLTLNSRHAEIPAERLLPLLQENEADLVTAAMNSGLQQYPEQILPQVEHFLNADLAWKRKALADNLAFLPQAQRQESAQILLQDPDNEIREAAVKSLGKAHKPENLSLLLLATDDEDAWVRQAAVAGLEQLSGAEVDQKIISLLMSDSDFMVRSRAAEALAEHDTEPVAQALAKALEDDKPSVRVQAVIGLFTHKAAPSLDCLKKMLQDPDRNVVLTTLEHLPRKSIPGAAELITPYLNAEDVQLRSAAQAAQASLSAS